MRENLKLTLVDIPKRKKVRYDYIIVNAFKVEERRLGGTSMTNWWPVSDEEWERLNFPERFK